MVELKEIIFLVVFISIFGGPFIYSVLKSKKRNRSDDQAKKDREVK